MSERERERGKGVDTNRGCNSRQLVARRWRPQAPVIERTSGEQISRRPAPTPGAKLIPSRKNKKKATPPMSTSIHVSLDPNSSRATMLESTQQTPKTGAPDTRRPGRDICN